MSLSHGPRKISYLFVLNPFGPLKLGHLLCVLLVLRNFGTYPLFVFLVLCNAGTYPLCILLLKFWHLYVVCPFCALKFSHSSDVCPFSPLEFCHLFVPSLLGSRKFWHLPVSSPIVFRQFFHIRVFYRNCLQYLNFVIYKFVLSEIFEIQPIQMMFSAISPLTALAFVPGQQSFPEFAEIVTEVPIRQDSFCFEIIHDFPPRLNPALT